MHTPELVQSSVRLSPSIRPVVTTAACQDWGRMITVTVDTNMLDEAALARLYAIAEEKGVELDVTTVTVNRRERGDSGGLTTIAEPMVWDESRWGEGAWGDGRTVRELTVIGETPIGSGVVAGVADLTRFEAILRVISNGSFPASGKRGDLTGPQRRQLRDAMSLEAHARDGRDVFVTGDVKGFVNHGRRAALEQICSTRIIAPDDLGVSWP